MKQFSKILLATSLLSSAAIAATDTSATFDVEATVESIITISHVDDVDFGSFTPGDDAKNGDSFVETESFCVYTNAASFDLEVNTSSSDDSKFHMEGAANFGLLPYYVTISAAEYDFESGNFSMVEYASDVRPGDTVSGLQYSKDYYADTDCNSSEYLQENVQVDLTLTGYDIITALPDDYLDTFIVIARTVGGEFGG